jgi:hypothetical protein
MDSISLMIEELITDISYVDTSRPRFHPPKDALAGSRYETKRPSGISAGGNGKTMEHCTISVSPQKGAFRLPFIVDRPVKEPRGGSIVMGITRSVVVN